MRKAWFRMIGTIVGAVMIVALNACFPQDRFAFLALLALWFAFCAFAATLLRNFASYAAALAGYTAAIIAADTLGATGGPDGQVFMLAVTRASEICIGIACAGIVLAGTDFGGAQRQLADVVRRFGGRDCRPICPHAGASGITTAGHASSATRAHPARHRARPGGRPGDRGIQPIALPLAGAAEGGGGPVHGARWLARRCSAPEQIAGRRGSAGGRDHPEQPSARVAVRAGTGSLDALDG